MRSAAAALLALCVTTHGLLVEHCCMGSLGTSRCTCPKMTAAEDIPTTYAAYVARRRRIEAETLGSQTVAAHGGEPPALPSGRLAQPVLDRVSERLRHLVRSPFGERSEGMVVPTATGTGRDEAGEGRQLLKKIKDAGIAGVVSYGLVQLVFWGLSIPVCIVGYYQVTGHWPDLSDPEDQAKLGAEAFAFLNLARLAIPLRIALALSMTDGVQKNVINRFKGVIHNERGPDHGESN
jgi:hypothetical protein